MHIKTKPNPFKPLDLVVHVHNGKRGIVKEVKGHMVTIEVVYPKGPGGIVEDAKYSCKHLKLFMPAAQVIQGAQAIQKKNERSLKGRIRSAFRRVKSVFI